MGPKQKENGAKRGAMGMGGMGGMGGMMDAYEQLERSYKIVRNKVEFYE